MSDDRTYKTLRRNRKFEEELWRAICSLASSSDNIKRRLERAYEYHIVYLQPESIPQERNRRRLVDIKKRLTKNHTAQVADAIRHLRLKSCRGMVCDLCDIYWEYVNFEWNRNL